MHSNDSGKRTRTVRELGGEIWAELHYRIPNETLDWQVREQVLDVVMGVLARHIGTAIENDADLPVTPLPSNDKTDVR